MGLKRAKSSVADYIGKKPEEQPTPSSNSEEQSVPTNAVAVEHTEKVAKTQKRKTANQQRRKLTTPQINNAANSRAGGNDETKRRINFRVYHLEAGISPTFDEYVEGEDEQFAMKTIITDALDAWEIAVQNGLEIPKKPEYSKAIATYQTSRVISTEVYEKARQVFDPFSKKAEHTVATLIAKAALVHFIKEDM